MDQIRKFTRKLNAKLRKHVEEVIEHILLNHWEGLDIKPLQGKQGWFRCRIGDIRILFVRLPNGVLVLKRAGFRGEVYKGL